MSPTTPPGANQNSSNPPSATTLALQAAAFRAAALKEKPNSNRCANCQGLEQYWKLLHCETANGCARAFHPGCIDPATDGAIVEGGYICKWCWPMWTLEKRERGDGGDVVMGGVGENEGVEGPVGQVTGAASFEPVTLNLTGDGNGDGVEEYGSQDYQSGNHEDREGDNINATPVQAQPPTAGLGESHAYQDEAGGTRERPSTDEEASQRFWGNLDDISYYDGALVDEMTGANGRPKSPVGNQDGMIPHAQQPTAAGNGTPTIPYDANWTPMPDPPPTPTPLARNIARQKRVRAQGDMLNGDSALQNKRIKTLSDAQNTQPGQTQSAPPPTSQPRTLPPAAPLPSPRSEARRPANQRLQPSQVQRSRPNLPYPFNMLLNWPTLPPRSPPINGQGGTMSRRPSNNMPPLSFTPSANRQNNMQPPYSYPPANRQMPGHRNPDFQKQRIPSFNSSDLRQILSHRFSGVQQHPSIALQDGLTLRPQSPHTNGQAPARRQSNYATQAPSLSPPLNRQNPEQHMPGPQQQPMDAFVRTSPMPNPFVEQGGAAVEWRPPPANGQPFTDPHIGGGEVQRHERPRNGFVEEQGRRWW